MALSDVRNLLVQAISAIDALQAPPPNPAITTADQLDRALAATVAGGPPIRLDPTLVYPAPLTIRVPVTLASAVPPGRMTPDQPLPLFQGGLTIGADDVTLIGLDVRHPNPLMDILTYSGARTILDRVRILGDPTKGAKRGIAANGGGDCQILRTWIDDCFQTYPGNDSQALCAWDMAPGLVIDDCFLRAGSETILIGGADASSAARMPANISITNCTLTKRPEWKALPIGVKNTLELKACQHVTVSNCDISQSWSGHGQDGYLLELTVRNQDGRAPWSTVQDVTITGNRFASGAAAVNMLGLDNIVEMKAGRAVPIGTVRPSVRMARITLSKNQWTALDPVAASAVAGQPGSPKLIQIGQGPTEVTIDGDTFAGVNLTSQLYFYGAPPLVNCTVKNVTWPKTKYGVFGDKVSVGQAWAQYVASGVLGPNTEV